MTVDEIQKLTVETVDAEGRVGVSALLAGLSMIKEDSASSYEEIRSKLLANRYVASEEDQKWYAEKVTEDLGRIVLDMMYAADAVGAPFSALIRAAKKQLPSE